MNVTTKNLSSLKFNSCLSTSVNTRVLPTIYFARQATETYPFFCIELRLIFSYN